MSKHLPTEARKIEEVAVAAKELDRLIRCALDQVKSGSPRTSVSIHHDFRVRECIRAIYDADERAWDDFLRSCCFDVK